MSTLHHLNCRAMCSVLLCFIAVLANVVIVNQLVGMYISTCISIHIRPDVEACGFQKMLVRSCKCTREFKNVYTSYCARRLYKRLLCGASLLVFRNGRCVSTGRNAERYYGHINGARVVNRVYSGRIGKRIDLLRLHREDHRLFYEPEIFTGARLTYNSATVVIFHSGSYFITGVTDDTLCAPIHAYLQQYGRD